MIRGLGYSNTDFDTARPGRLCRGRERWIRRWDDPGMTLKRLVLSGAAFSDDSARDAIRGLTRIELDIGALVRTVFPTEQLVAFKEEGQLSLAPEILGDEGQYWNQLSGGRMVEPCQRWQLPIDDDAQMASLIADDAVDGFLVAPEMPLAKELVEAIYVLTGQGNDSEWPVVRFLPVAMKEILEHCKALICVHQDKHGPALGIYTLDSLERTEGLKALAIDTGCLPVPFAIPPMLARWDRALYELRLQWDEAERGEFPVPAAEEASRWGGRRLRTSQQEEPVLVEE
jgi:hypothetical protein